MTNPEKVTAVPRTGDSVFHRPSGERWLVAYVQGDRVAWCGWPEGEAKVSDCEVIRRCTDEESDKLLSDMAAMHHTEDARCRYARAMLAERDKGQETG